ncbi:28S ribosomal protein S18a, mitochondrial [Habropoda laboriosa]|uniref:28S ribosomal protein S18a, mitochondrial n=1 Tax=Habropoda laboriosa TaxID=597456 RepID=A0A0L7QMH6_9HYME|nr:PREDICTED: 28S ribosomal protein S18a, mitochondrial [Habropoda laboriosa]KOC59749.1 28S ribosomal protein S18a, mitochondrial [Habropoda laboriosa]
MAALYRVINYLGKNILSIGQNRNISLSATTRLKEIIEKKEGNTIIFEAVIKEDTNDERFLKPKNGACPICSSGLDIKHTDVLILNQFVRSDGYILPRRITGLCNVQQKRISSLIIMAQSAGLMLRADPKGGLLHPLRRRKWKKFNTYFDESTIKAKYK